MDTALLSNDLERVRAHLFSPSHRINLQLLEWGHRICGNPCISPDICLDWPALATELQVCRSVVSYLFDCAHLLFRHAGTLLLTHLSPYLLLLAANGFSLKTSLAIVAGC